MQSLLNGSRKAIKKLDGVKDATVDLAGKTAKIELSDSVLDDILIKAVGRCRIRGY